MRCACLTIDSLNGFGLCSALESIKDVEQNVRPSESVATVKNNDQTSRRTGVEGRREKKRVRRYQDELHVAMLEND